MAVRRAGGDGPGYRAEHCSPTRARSLVRTESETLRVEADPFAAEFYEHVGARRIGEAPSASIAGRVLPLYAIDVTSNL